MKSLKFIVRFFLFVLALFAVAASTHAQQCPGYNPTMTQGSPDAASGMIPADACSGRSGGTWSFYETNSLTDYCGSYATGGYLSYYSTVTGNGVASCTPVHVYCEPYFYAYLTPAQNQQDYNRFYYQAYDETYISSSGCVRSGPYSRQDFWQCGWYSCPPNPVGGGSSCPNPVGDPPYCGAGNNPSWNTSSCQWDCVPGGNSPILVDVSGHGFELTNAAGGVSYDIHGNGSPLQIGWTAPGAKNAFLCLPDAYGNCDSGKQLFGNVTPQPASATPNGFAALAVYDGNHDGVIDSRDAIFSSLRLWIDANHDGISQSNELFTLPALGITSISLNYKWDQRTDQYGNVFRYRAQVGSTDGAGRLAYDVFLVADPTTAAKAKVCPPRPFITLKEEKTLLR